jgi:L-iditol 2-dehydrogenase
VNINGGFSEEFVISSKYVLPVPDDLSDRRAVLIEPFAVIVHAFKKVNISKDTTVAIIGCGNEGMLAAALANHLGASVTAMDINSEKFDLIRIVGSIRVFHPDRSGMKSLMSWWRPPDQVKLLNWRLGLQLQVETL